MPSSPSHDWRVHGDVGSGWPKGHALPSTPNGSRGHELLLPNDRLPVGVCHRAGVERTMTKRAIARAGQKNGGREGDAGQVGWCIGVLEREVRKRLCRRKLVRCTHGRRVKCAINRDRVRLLALKARERGRGRGRGEEREVIFLDGYRSFLANDKTKTNTIHTIALSLPPVPSLHFPSLCFSIFLSVCLCLCLSLSHTDTHTHTHTHLWCWKMWDTHFHLNAHVGTADKVERTPYTYMYKCEQTTIKPTCIEELCLCKSHLSESSFIQTLLVTELSDMYNYAYIHQSLAQSLNTWWEL